MKRGEAVFASMLHLEHSALLTSTQLAKLVQPVWKIFLRSDYITVPE